MQIRHRTRRAFSWSSFIREVMPQNHNPQPAKPDKSSEARGNSEACGLIIMIRRMWYSRKLEGTASGHPLDTNGSQSCAQKRRRQRRLLVVAIVGLSA